MTSDFLLTQMNSALLTVLIVTAPVLITAVAVGILVGLAQALTQIHDQTLPQAVKLIATLLILITLGPVLAKQIVNHATVGLDEFPVITR